MVRSRRRRRGGGLCPLRLCVVFEVVVGGAVERA